MQVSSVENNIISRSTNPESNTKFEIKKFAGSVQRPEIAKIARKWQRWARTRQYRAKKIKDVTENVFMDSYTISLLIAECLEKPHDTYKTVYTQIFVCRDTSSNPQSIALTNHLSGPKGYLKIAHLATNPNNIRSPINNQQKERVQGAATAIIVHLAKQCFAKKIDWKDKSLHPEIKGIFLESIDSAIPFYEKLGFERFLDVKSEEEFCTPMRLKAEKMQQLVLTKG